jgi:hypothetical protein
MLLALLLPPIIGWYGPTAYRYVTDRIVGREHIPHLPLEGPPGIRGPHAIPEEVLRRQAVEQPSRYVFRPSDD